MVQKQKQVLDVRQRNKVLGKEIQRHATTGDGGQRPATTLMEEAKTLKEDLQKFEALENETKQEIEQLALDIVNLTSNKTPIGEEPEIIGHINGERPPQVSSGRSHVDIGRQLDILDFEASATTSGSGWYFLKNEAALLEQALIQYALSVAVKKGWKVMTPPSIVYGHIAGACGFMPRDANSQQVYNVGNGSTNGDGVNPVLAGTAEIPFAGSQANKTLKASELPLRVIGPSRCYRAEAGGQGVDTKGLYRVHEFTKVEMFAWTLPPAPLDESNQRFITSDTLEDVSQTDIIFSELLSIQTEILTSLGLHAKILEMPTADLGASASRKIDIEAFFPSRTAIDGGYGEVTSASICTDYQTRRLSTRLQYHEGQGKLEFPHTLNGTAMAVPRVLACLLENGWDEGTGTVTIPVVLRPFMLGGIERIGPGKKG